MMASYQLPDLPYARDALAPHLSAESFDFHYDKHHAAYVAKLNALLSGHEWAGLPLEEIIVRAAHEQGTQALFNNAAQHWNHSLFWSSLRPPGDMVVPLLLEERIEADFGSVDAFKRAFVAAGASVFGSGWVWLIEERQGLAIITSANADSPLLWGKPALLVCDVWEHAYYIDYRSGRPAFLQAFVDHLINWETAARRLSEAAAHA
jgi:Fe-Mn family superoxide dismutase